MSLTLGKKDNCANPYETNRDYLRILTSLQMKALKGMRWIKEETYIHDGLGLLYVPSAEPCKMSARDLFTRNSMNYFMNELRENIMGL